jgi:hypothetical protein
MPTTTWTFPKETWESQLFLVHPENEMKAPHVLDPAVAGTGTEEGGMSSLIQVYIRFLKPGTKLVPALVAGDWMHISGLSSSHRLDRVDRHGCSLKKIWWI